MWSRLFSRYWGLSSSLSRLFSHGLRIVRRDDGSLRRSLNRQPAAGGLTRPISIRPFGKMTARSSLVLVIALTLLLSGCGLNRKSSRPPVVVVSNDREVVIVDRNTDLADREGWILISAGHWKEKEDDLNDSNAGWSECLCQLRGENPATCSGDAPDTPTNPLPFMPD